MTHCPWSPPNHVVIPDPAAVPLPKDSVGQCRNPACLLLYRVVSDTPYVLQREVGLSRFVVQALALALPGADEVRRAAGDALDATQPISLAPEPEGQDPCD